MQIEMQIDDRQIHLFDSREFLNAEITFYIQ